MRKPRTTEEWQTAVDIANWAIHLEAAKAFGLVTGGPQFDLHRCEQLLDEGFELGITPRPGSVEGLTQAYNSR